jgi:hypothetical protein
LKGIIGLEEPVQMLERNGNLFLVDANRGVYIFDMFGALVNFVEIIGVQWIQVDVNNLFYVSDGRLVGYNFKTKITFNSALAEPFNALFQYIKDKMYFLSPELLRVYKIV